MGVELESIEQSGFDLSISQDPIASHVSRTATDTAEWQDCTAAGCFSPLPASAERHGRGSNSQLSVGRGLYFGDLSGDGITDLVQHDEHRIFVSKANFEYTEVSHLTSPDTIQRLIVGDFDGVGWDQVCALSSAAAHCFGIEPDADQEELRLWFRQVGNPILPNEEVIVGNFDSDRADELLLYDPTKASFRMLEYMRSPGRMRFDQKSRYAPGDLNGFSPNMQVRAGDWTGDGRTDIVGVNSLRQVIAFKALTDNAGKDTFAWDFTTAWDTVAAGEEFFLAHADGDAKDDLALHNTSTGAVRFKRVEYNNTNPRLLSVGAGEIHALPNSELRPSWGHAGSPSRDDMFMLVDDKTLYSYEAATTSSGSDTYKWAWNRLAPNNHYGWPETKKKRTLFVPCKFSDDSSEPIDNNTLWLLPERIRDYYWEVTMGRIDLDPDPTFWVQVPFSSDSNQAKDRATIGDSCARAAGKDPADYAVIVTIKNTEHGAGWTSGKYSIMSPSTFDVFFTVHEIGHVLGLSHTANDIEGFDHGSYGNPWDPMSAGYAYTYLNPFGRLEATGFTRGSLALLGAGAPQRVKRLSVGYSKQKIWLSAVNRPATGEFNEILIDGVDTTSRFSVEYREPSGFDRSIPRQTVLIHYLKIGSGGDPMTGWLRSSQDGVFDSASGDLGVPWTQSERQPGESYTHQRYGTIKVLRFVKHMAEIEVTPP